MVVSRKEKKSFLGKNLHYLRKLKGMTLEDMAEMLVLNSKSSYKAYEEERALPDIHKVMKLASFFDVGVAEILYQDLSILKNTKVDNEDRFFEVTKVPVAAAAGYASSFGDNNYVQNLNTIKIPYKPYGIARAFDIAGDSMEPNINDGATIIGIRIGASELRDNKSYIIVSVDGVQCKNVRVDKESDYVYLISTNPKYPIKHIRKDDIMEMWEIWKIL